MSNLSSEYLRIEKPLMPYAILMISSVLKVRASMLLHIPRELRDEI